LGKKKTPWGGSLTGRQPKGRSKKKDKVPSLRGGGGGGEYRAHAKKKEPSLLLLWVDTCERERAGKGNKPASECIGTASLLNNGTG